MAVHIEDGDYILRQPTEKGPEVGQLVVIGYEQHWFLYTEVSRDLKEILEHKPDTEKKSEYERPTGSSPGAVNLAFEWKAPSILPFKVSTRKASIDSRIKVQYIHADTSGKESPLPTGETGGALPQVDPWKYGIYQKGLLVGELWVEVAKVGTLEKWALSNASTDPRVGVYTAPSSSGGAYALKPTALITDPIKLYGASVDTILAACV